MPELALKIHLSLNLSDEHGLADSVDSVCSIELAPSPSIETLGLALSDGKAAWLATIRLAGFAPVPGRSGRRGLTRTLRLPRTQMPATIEFLLNRGCAYWVQAGFNARSSKALA